MEFEVPEGFGVEVSRGRIALKSQAGNEVVAFNPRLVKAEFANGKITLTGNAKKENKETKSAVHSIAKHLRNAVQGIREPFTKKLSVVYAHFPISVEAKGSEIQIKNFLGEKVPRKARIVGNAKVEIKGQEITVTGQNRYEVGQTASNIARATKITDRDERVFQDGIYYEE